ncbi:MAG: GDSL-type esterase/lipase family protein [Chthoniobacteraceae bacterium]
MSSPTPTLLILALAIVARAQDFPLAPAVECTPRKGLPNFLAKAAKPGAQLKIAYLGGSITAQPGWRVKSLEHLRTTFPGAKFSEVNAAIGGTGSDLGVFRVKQDVLDHAPDLIFVEFAVNDGGAVPQQVIRCMEGIVRQAWRALPESDICFVYTITEALVRPLTEDQFPRAASAMERVAEHYGIPSIHMAMEVAKLVKERRLVWKAALPKTDEEKKALGGKFVFAPDSVHPYPETGHELYLAAIVRSLGPIRAASGKAGAHPLGTPLAADNYEHAKLVPISAATLSSGFSKADAAKDDLAKRFTRLKDLHCATKPGESISFKFKGTRAGIFHIVGPDSGQVTITLDGKATVRTGFDPYCSSFRLNTLLIGTDLPDAVHTVKIDIHPEQPDKVAILAKRAMTMDKPERFVGTAFYPGAILLLGELVK